MKGRHLLPAFPRDLLRKSKGVGGSNGRVGVSYMCRGSGGEGGNNSTQTEAVRTLVKISSWNPGGSWPDRDTNWSKQGTQLDACVLVRSTLGRWGEVVVGGGDLDFWCSLD